MSVITKHKPGAFCWFELATTNQIGAKKFYEALFGWTSEDSPIGPAEFYTTFSVAAGPIGAAYTMRREQQGMPPSWMIYIAVESADVAAERAVELGAAIIAPPFDVMGLGRMSVIQDPTGGMFSVWEAKSHIGVGVVHERGAVVWADFSTPDPARASQFYGSLFGWTMAGGKNEVHVQAGDYIHIVNDGDFIGGIPPADHRDPNMPAHWMIYVSVEDATKAVASAQALGGRLLHGPMTIERARTFAVLSDLQGAVFAVVDEKG